MPSSYGWKYSPARPAKLYSLALLAILFVSSANGQGQSDDEERVGPPALLSAPLSEIPGTNLVVVELNFAEGRKNSVRRVESSRESVDIVEPAENRIGHDSAARLS